MKQKERSAHEIPSLNAILVIPSEVQSAPAGMLICIHVSKHSWTAGQGFPGLRWVPRRRMNDRSVQMRTVSQLADVPALLTS